MLAERIRDQLPKTQEERDAIFAEIMNNLGGEDRPHVRFPSWVDYGAIFILAVASIAVMATATSSGFHGLEWVVTGLFLGYLGSWIVNRPVSRKR